MANFEGDTQPIIPVGRERERESPLWRLAYFNSKSYALSCEIWARTWEFWGNLEVRIFARHPPTKLNLKLPLPQLNECLPFSWPSWPPRTCTGRGPQSPSCCKQRFAHNAKRTRLSNTLLLPLPRPNLVVHVAPCNSRCVGPLHTQGWRPLTMAVQELLLVEKAETVQVHFTLGGEGPKIQRKVRGWKVYMESYMAGCG